MNGGKNPQRLGNHHPNIVPYGLYDTMNGSVVICVGTARQFEGLMRALGLNMGDERIGRFMSNEVRVERRE